jgi:hypothetical protein
MLNSAKNLSLLDERFWRDQKNWPHDSPGYVFLPRAFHEIGTANYRGGWARPPHVNEPKEPEDLEEPADDCIDEEIWDKYEQEDDRYEDACEEARADCENMWENVARLIAEACKTSALVSAVRAKVGGEMNELEPHYWNTESFEARFFRCDISLTYPFAKSRIDRSHWIYVTRDSLDRYLGKSPTTDAGMQSNTRGRSREPASDISSRRSSLPASKEQIREVANKIYADPVNDRPNMNEAWDLVKKELPNARRTRVWEVLREDAFANQRRSVGESIRR